MKVALLWRCPQQWVKPRKVKVPGFALSSLLAERLTARSRSVGLVRIQFQAEANAAFIYFSMKSPVTDSLDTAFKYSHSTTPEAKFAFDLHPNCSACSLTLSA